MSELGDIDGVGNTYEEKLEEAGIDSVNKLANSSVEDLADAGIAEGSAEKIINRAQKQGVMMQSGAEVEEEQDNARYISTGMQPLDRMLGGGFQGGFLIGISGESKAGKTQFALQSLAAAADYTDGACIYIETEPNRFHIDRVKSLCRKDDSYKQIHLIQAHNADSEADNLKLQRNAYDAVKDAFDEVSMVVVDSFVANFRLSGEFESRADLPKRNTMIADHLEGLQSLANEFDCPVLMTLQVMGNPDQFSGSNVDIWGSVLMDHTITYLIHMSHAKGELKEASMKGHPARPDDSVMMKIPENAPLEAME